MRRKEIPKRSGGVRVIFCPSAHERKVLRNELKTIVAHNATTLPCAHGFMAERSPLTAAKQHVGFAITIGLDLKDFFPSVKPEMVKGLVPKTLSPICWSGDGCGQGLPTAPAIANLAARPLDEAIVKYCKKLEKEHEGLRHAYTRYADDLSVSFSVDPGQTEIEKVKAKVTEIVRRCGFKPNPRKWRVQRASGGRREIVGLLVGDTSDPIRPTRKWRREHRALKHKIHMLERRSHTPGMAVEISKLRMTAQGQRQWLEPKTPLTSAEKAARIAAMADTSAIAEANKLCEKWSQLPMPHVRRVIPAVSITLPNGWIARITNDPVYYIGVSDYVTRGQRTASCLRTGMVWNSGFGMYGGAGAWWWHLRGASIAHIVDPSIIVEALGVKRPAQLARVLVFKLTNGKTYRQRKMYYEGERPYRELTSFITAQGIENLPERGLGGVATIGEVARSAKLRQPYLDGGSFRTTTKQDRRAYDSVWF